MWSHTYINVLPHRRIRALVTWVKVSAHAARWAQAQCVVKNPAQLHNQSWSLEQSIIPKIDCWTMDIEGLHTTFQMQGFCDVKTLSQGIISRHFSGFHVTYNLDKSIEKKKRFDCVHSLKTGGCVQNEAITFKRESEDTSHHLKCFCLTADKVQLFLCFLACVEFAYEQKPGSSVLTRTCISKCL